jgi:hypothetical protein
MTDATPRAPRLGRLVRRETHSPRSAAAITLAVVLILVLAWLGTEVVLQLIGAPALLAAPSDMIAFVVDAQAQNTALFGIAGILVAVVGLILLVTGLAPGRRARHELPARRGSVVVDNEVIASAIARTASRAAGVDPDNCTVSVSHRRAEIQLMPTSGSPVDEAAVLSAVIAHLERLDLTPPVSARLIVSSHAKVGA